MKLAEGISQVEITLCPSDKVIAIESSVGNIFMLKLEGEFP